MMRKSWINRRLLAGISVLAIIVAAGEAGAETFDFTGREATYLVPTTGLYDILAFGAQGGTGAQRTSGGFGAEAGGEVTLMAGTTLTILAGGMGGSGDFGFGYGGGGGGGSFVFEGRTPLVAAGGGGGGSYNGVVGGPGLITADGGGNYGGTHAAGGGGGGVYGGGGGAGVSGGGQDGGRGGGAGAADLVSPGTHYAAGGFGGGGGSGLDGGGGGGGLAGGAGAGRGGYGGGSYVMPGATGVVLESGVNADNGSVTINSVATVVPEPATWTMMAAGFAGLGALALRRKKPTPA